jgi:anaerobic magnesium-protoporphyrin IX monomethyl ester cyclase
MPPLGLLYIGTVLKKAGHSVTIRDLLVDGLPSDFTEYGLVGISCTTGQFSEAIKYAGLAYKEGIPVVLGGAHPTFTVNEMFGTGTVDYVVRGEGENTIKELAAFLEGGAPGAVPENIKGLSWRDPRTGEIINNEARPFIEDINELPMPDRSLLAMEKYKECKLEKVNPATTLITSRGCPYDCSFCVATQMTGKRWRYLSVPRVLDEVEDILSYGFTGIFFVDDNISASPKRVFAL